MKIILNGRKFASVVGSIEFSETTLVKASAVMGEVTLDVSTDSAPLEGGVTFAERELARFGHRISAIKSIRERTGMGLKDSKDAIDKAVPYNPTAQRYGDSSLPPSHY